MSWTISVGDSYITSGFGSTKPASPKHLLSRGRKFQILDIKEYKSGVGKYSQHPLFKVSYKGV